MANDNVAVQKNFTGSTQTWIFYGLEVFILALRFLARLRQNKRWQLDDVFALMSLVFLTWNAVGTYLSMPFINAATDGEGLLGLDPADQTTLRPSKDWAYVVLFAYFCLMYSLKGCAIVLYRRLTLGLWQRKIILWNAVACVILWLVSTLTYILPCVPFSVRFKVIPEPKYIGICPYWPKTLYVFEAGNLFTDLVFLFVGVPIVYSLQIPLLKKLAIGLVLSSGIMVIVSGIVRCAIVETSTNAVNATWANIEVFIATLAVNVPIIRALFSPSTWINSNNSLGRKGYSNGHELTTRSRLKSHQQSNTILASQGDGTFRGDSTDKIVDADGKWKDDGESSNVSLSHPEGSDSVENSKGSNPYVIHTTTTYSVRPTSQSGDRQGRDKSTGVKAWVSAV